MNPIIKNILAVIIGVIIGSMVNIGIIMISPLIIPPPAGANLDTMEGLIAAMPSFQIKHFIFPFLAHAIGTFAGAFVAAKIAATYKLQLAIGVGVYFLLGGISAVYMIPGPLWFAILDLVVSYIPMAFLAGKLADKKNNSFI